MSSSQVRALIKSFRQRHQIWVKFKFIKSSDSTPPPPFDSIVPHSHYFWDPFVMIRGFNMHTTPSFGLKVPESKILKLCPGTS